MPGDRSLVVQAVPHYDPTITSLESKTRPEESPEPLEASVFDDVEDSVDRWVSVAVAGALTLFTGLLILIGLSRGSGYPTLGGQAIGVGLLELVLGTLVAFSVRPSTTLAVALAGVVAVAEGVLIVWDGAGLAWMVAAVSLAMGLGCVGAGALQAARAWIVLYTEDRTTG